MTGESLEQFGERLRRETEAAYRASPYSVLSLDYFARFGRDPEARPASDETAIAPGWSISIASDALEPAGRMAGHLAEFLSAAMGLAVPVVREGDAPEGGEGRRIRLAERGGGDPSVPESFTISATRDRVAVSGRDSQGLRDGVVRLADALGFRRAPFVRRGETIYRPRLRVRLGAVPFLGTYRDVVFLGYNAVFAGGGDLYALSRSDAIPALAERRGPLPEPAREARRYGLKTFAFLNTRRKFPEDHPVFRQHPDIRGARTWSADGEFTLCTEHPLVRRYLAESVRGVMEADPDLDGVVLIIGGEGFYHCFMRPHGADRGHTNCPRCEALGPDRVVSNLCNLLAGAVRAVNPRAEVVAWPYSAEHVWSADRAQSGFIRALEPGAALFTEMEKDEYVEKPGGIRKHLWDYSIDLIGPGARAREQIALCRERGVSIYLKSEPELAFEGARLPHVPCMDRWAQRAEALAACGGDGAWVFPAFRPLYGTSAAEVHKHFWWDPTPDAETTLRTLAARLAGEAAGPHLRRAWGHVSDAIAWSPELPPYYTGPTYLGPAHPMCADAKAELPPVFSGYYLFMAEARDADGLKPRPTYLTQARGDVPAFEGCYRRMEAKLARAAEEVAAAEPLVPERHALTFQAEASPIRWFYHTARTTANFYTSCRLRDALRGGATDAAARMAEWRAILEDERENARAAAAVARADVRLDFYYGSDHSFPHLTEMMEAKLGLLDRELGEVLPRIAREFGLPGK